MRNKRTWMLTLFLVAAASPLSAVESIKYTPPRFPSYVKPPKTIEDIMPFAVRRYAPWHRVTTIPELC